MIVGPVAYPNTEKCTNCGRESVLLAGYNKRLCIQCIGPITGLSVVGSPDKFYTVMNLSQFPIDIGRIMSGMPGQAVIPPQGSVFAQ